MTAPDPFAAALRLLGTRDRSEAELAERLARKGFADRDIASALKRCRDLGYLDDDRFARVRARTLLRTGRGAGGRILADLKSRGVDETIAREALEELEGEFVPEEMLRQLLERRYPEFIYASADERQRRRVVSWFLRRGFSLSAVMAVLKSRETR